MFKRKTTLPARPPIPSKDEIIDDLTQATPDDVVFKIDPKDKLFILDAHDINDLPEDLNDSGLKDQTEFLDPHQAYIKVASFMEKMNHLEKHLSELEKNKNNLKILEENLLSDITKVEEEFKKRSET
ncbi:hypothetical protein HNY73_004255 [Argiope bruennichi]|uniref:Uncharacterized protein n=2 Tax=Argiope bruennichi TaxID=94029 RepID=A0A8T0FQS7_ARGBR|nr:hypothetical protein HNY73_004255 [Argiope bruennichi]